MAAEITHLNGIVKSAHTLLKECKANRVRTLVWMIEQPDGLRQWSIAGDPPLDLDAFLASLARLQHHYLSIEEALEAEAEIEGSV
jgi:hypothetical protein